MDSTTTVLVAAADDAVADVLELVADLARRSGGVVEDRAASSRIVAAFASASVAVRVAREALGRAGAHDLDVRARVGIAVGELHSDEIVASSVARTARALCDAAPPGSIYGDQLVQLLVAGEIEGITAVGSIPFGDAGSEVHAFAIPWEPVPAERLRVVVADDAALIRTGLVRLLRDEGFVVTAEVGDATALLAAVEADPPDLVVTDVRMPPDGTDDGLRAAASIRERHPAVSVLVLSQYVEPRAAAALLDERVAGVGYLLKERVGELSEFVETCRTVAAGGRVIDSTVAEQLFAHRRDDDALGRLTEREREVLALMAQGRSNAAIADALAMSAKTLEVHVRSIFQKLDLPASPDDHRRVAAVVRWLQAV